MYLKNKSKINSMIQLHLCLISGGLELDQLIIIIILWLLAEADRFKEIDDGMVGLLVYNKIHPVTNVLGF